MNRGFLILAVALSIGAISFGTAAPVHAQSWVPFRATFAEQFTSTPCPFPTICLNATGTGQATHLGMSTEALSATFDLLTFLGAGCAPVVSSPATFTAANGDHIFITRTGQTCATGATTGVNILTYVVTGGTGRFLGAGGSGIATGTFSFSGSSGTAITTYVGAVSSPGSLN